MSCPTLYSEMIKNRFSACPSDKDSESITEEIIQKVTSEMSMLYGMNELDEIRPRIRTSIIAVDLSIFEYRWDSLTVRRDSLCGAAKVSNIKRWDVNVRDIVVSAFRTRCKNAKMLMVTTEDSHSYSDGIPMEVGHACISALMGRMTNKIDFSKVPLINRRIATITTDDEGNTRSKLIKRKVKFSEQDNIPLNIRSPRRLYQSERKQTSSLLKQP